MKSSEKPPRNREAEYWTVVRDCLCEFHGMTRAEAQRKAKRMRDKLEAIDDGGPEDMIYHAEPWDTACGIARNRMQVGPHAERYLYLRDTKHGYLYPQSPAAVSAPPARPATAKPVCRAPVPV